MRVFYCQSSNRPDLIGASLDVDEVLELARALMMQPGARMGLPVELRLGGMSKAEFEAARLFPLDLLPEARFGTALPGPSIATALLTE